MDAPNLLEPPSQLISAVRDSLDNIELAVNAYVFGGKHSSYRTVAVELRKLLLDKDAVRSFLGSTKMHNLFEAVYGKGDRIYLQSFLPKSGTITQDGYFDVGPPLHVTPTSILVHASKADQLIPLRQWLDECPVHDSNGAVRKTAKVLQDVANKEGAHIINWSRTDWRNKAGIALIPARSGEPTKEQITSAPYEANWQQFVIGAGARLLYARKRENGKWRQMFTYSLDASELGNVGSGDTVTLQRRVGGVVVNEQKESRAD